MGEGVQDAQAVGWSMARRSALAWSVQAMLLGVHAHCPGRCGSASSGVLSHALEVFCGEAELGQDFLVGDDMFVIA